MEKYLKIPEAALIMGITQQAVYKQIRRYALKATKILGVTHTTLDWIEEYNKHKHSKGRHSIFNGRPVFDEEKGEYSVCMVAERLGVDRMFVLNRILKGEIIAFKRGSYYVIRDEHLQLYLQEQEKGAKQLAN